MFVRLCDWNFSGDRERQIVCLLDCVTGTVQVTEGGRCPPRGRQILYLRTTGTAPRAADISSRATDSVLECGRSCTWGRQILYLRAADTVLEGDRYSPRGRQILYLRATDTLLAGGRHCTWGRQILPRGRQVIPRGRQIVSSRSADYVLEGGRYCTWGLQILSSRATDTLLKGDRDFTWGRQILPPRAAWWSLPERLIPAQLVRCKLNNIILYVVVIAADCESHRNSINVEPASATVCGTYRNYCDCSV